MYPPGEDVAVYEVIGNPPVFKGADQTNATRRSCPVALVNRGALGRIVGVAVAGLLGLLGPTALVAVTTNVCTVPLVSPEIVQLAVGAVTVHVRPAGDASAV